LLDKLVREPVDGVPCDVATLAQRKTPTASVGIPSEAEDIADRGDNALTSGSMPEPVSILTCPECGGVVWERGEQGLLFYRCHVGHTYTAETMAAEQAGALEATLWEALRMFEETAALQRKMAERARYGQPAMASAFEDRAAEAHSRAELIRGILLGEHG
jgi:two-component system chemotaxis response regulator CheB